MRDDLLRAVTSRVEDCCVNGNHEAVLCQDAADEARALLRAIDNSPQDLNVQDVVGTLYWLRYTLRRSRSDPDAEVDGRVALTRYSAIYAVAPDGVPTEAREFFDQLAAWESEASNLIDQAGMPGGLATLDRAIELLRRLEGCTADDDHRLPIRLTELGVALNHRFELEGDLTALEDSVDVLNRAVSLTRTGDLDCSSRLSLLKLCLLARHEVSEDPSDLDKALRIGHEVLDRADPDDPHMASYLADFVQLYMAQYKLTGDVASMDKAVYYGREALRKLPSGDLRSSVMSDLGLVLRHRGERVGDLESLNEAVEFNRDAAAAFSVEHFIWAGLRTNLSQALRAKGAITEDESCLREAVRVAEQVVLFVDREDTRRAGFLQNLGVARWSLHRTTGEVDELRTSVAALRESIATFQGRAPIGAVTTLGSALDALAEADNDDTLLDDSIRTHRRAVSALSAKDPEAALIRANLAAALRSRYARTHAPADRDEAIEQFRAVAELPDAPPSRRLRAARSWGRLEAEAGSWSAAQAGLEMAVALLPRVAARYLRRGDQERHLREEPWLVADAVAAALHNGAVDRAAELLEQGRGILLAHALDLRSDLTTLRSRDKTLAADFVRLRNALDSSDTADGGRQRLHNSDHRHRWARQWAETVAAIRRLDGFGRFLVPPNAANLRAAASDGPIVMVNVSEYRSDALIVQPDTIKVVELPLLTPDIMAANGFDFLAALDMELDSDLRQPLRDNAEARIREVLQWLWDVVTGPVLDQLGFLGRPTGATLPRVWWSPSSLLTFLPLHAAGDHSTADHNVPMTVLDRVISSYTPTVRALDDARRRRLRVPMMDAGNALVVAMPTTPGQPKLPGALEEASLIKTKLPSVTVLAGQDASKQAVLDKLADHAWVHFACHGCSDTDNPSASHLLIADAAELSIRDISQADVDGKLAYLSACSTSRGGIVLVDEAVHLAGAFQLAGYPHVVATMWPIYDNTAVQVAKDVYGGLSPGGNAQLVSTASVLHASVCSRRSEHPDAPWQWASYIHIGP